MIFLFLFFLFGRYYKIISPAESYSAILSKLREEGIAFEPDNGSELLPLATIEVYRLIISFLVER